MVAIKRGSLANIAAALDAAMRRKKTQAPPETPKERHDRRERELVDEMKRADAAVKKAKAAFAKAAAALASFRQGGHE